MIQPDLQSHLEQLIAQLRLSQRDAPEFGPQWNFYEGQIQAYEYVLDWTAQTTAASNKPS